MEKTNKKLMKKENLYNKSLTRKSSYLAVLRASLAIALFLCFIMSVYAAHPTKMSVQGKATDTNGVAVDNGNLTVNISSANNCNGDIYSETFIAAINNGIFNVLLGNDTSNNLSLNHNQDYYMCTIINNEQLGNPEKFIGGHGEIGEEDISNEITDNLTYLDANNIYTGSNNFTATTYISALNLNGNLIYPNNAADTYFYTSTSDPDVAGSILHITGGTGGDGNSDHAPKAGDVRIAGGQAGTGYSGYNGGDGGDVLLIPGQAGSASGGGYPGNDGKIYITDATSGIKDTNLYRNSANHLRTDDTFQAANLIGGDNSNLHSAAAKLKAAGSTTVDFSIHAAHHFGSVFPSFALIKSKGTIASPSAVADGNTIGIFRFRGYDGSNVQDSAYIKAVVDGAVSSGNVPMRLVFQTSPAGSNNMTDKFVIKSDGSLQIPADNQKLFFGSSQDAGIYYDGTNLVIDTNASGQDGLTWFSNNISTTGVNTRTSVYDKGEGNALDNIQDADYYIDNGEINHSRFYGYVTYDVTDFSKPEIEYYNKTFFNETTGEEYSVTMSRTIYPHKKLEEGVSLNKETDVFRQGIYELKQEIDFLKAELCKKDNSYGWC